MFSRKEYSKKYREENRDRIKKYFKEYGKTPRRRAYDSKRTNERHRKVRISVFTYYGNGTPSCVLCGHSKITSLSIDHIDGNGKQHRESLGFKSKITGVNFYEWLIRNGFPDGFRTLCMNCQFDERERMRAGAILRKSS